MVSRLTELRCSVSPFFFFRGSWVGGWTLHQLVSMKTKLRKDINMDMTLTVHVRYNLASVLECELVQKIHWLSGF